MRKIEEQMVAAIKGKYNWQLDNTSVKHTEDDDITKVYLHQNLIATFDWDNMVVAITHAGWQTRTTGSRLNVILSEFVGNVRYDWEPTTYLIRA